MKLLKRLLLVSILIVMVVGGVAQTRAQDDAQSALDAILADYVSDDEPGVVVLVGYGDEKWTSARGLASLEDGTPLTPDDSFRIGSITKTFVGTLMMQLVEEGEIELDAPMSTYLTDEYIGQIENGDEITVRQLLTMQSGIFDYTESYEFEDAIYDDPTYAWTAEDVLQFVWGEEAYFAPGEEFYYTNTNYILLELIINEVTDMSLTDALAAYIFEPVGMTHTYNEDGANMSTDIVQGYAYADDDNQIDNVTFVNEGVGLGDGGIISTAADLDLFIRALLDGEILEDDSLAEMTDFGAQSNYGLGISLDSFEDWQLIGHDGATAGFQSSMHYDPESGLSIIVLTNNFDSDIVEDLNIEILYTASEIEE